MSDERCDVSDETLVAYGDRYLPTDQVRRLDRHVQHCHACQSRLRAFREVDQLVRTTAMPLPKVSDQAKLIDLLQTRGAGRLGPHFARNSIAAALLLAALLIVLASPLGQLVGLSLGGNFGQSGEVPPRVDLGEQIVLEAPSPGAVTSAVGPSPLTVTIEGFDFGWGDQTQTASSTQPATVSAAPGMALSLPNLGATTHNFSIDALAINVDILPGETVTVMLPDDTVAGAYEFYCRIPGHKAAGMVGTLVVQ